MSVVVALMNCYDDGDTDEGDVMKMKMNRFRDQLETHRVEVPHTHTSKDTCIIKNTHTHITSFSLIDSKMTTWHLTYDHNGEISSRLNPWKVDLMVDLIFRTLRGWRGFRQHVISSSQAIIVLTALQQGLPISPWARGQKQIEF